MVDYYLSCKRKYGLLLAAVLLGLLASVLCAFRTGRERGLQESIARQVIRFHILANSDEEEDQELKLQVRDVILKQLELLLEDSGSVEESRAIIRENLESIEETAEAAVRSRGFFYPVHAGLVRDELPQKTYGDCTFPAGEYEALRVSIGEAKGHNWWCMVYPGLCFTEESGAYVSEESKELLKHVLTEEEFELVAKEQRITVKWKLWELWKERHG